MKNKDNFDDNDMLKDFWNRKATCYNKIIRFMEAKNIKNNEINEFIKLLDNYEIALNCWFLYNFISPSFEG